MPLWKSTVYSLQSTVKSFGSRKSEVGRHPQGFTFIELMIVMSIMALMTVLAFANIGSFRKEQELASATADIQSALRVAQTNSKSGVKCNGVAGVAWSIEFKDKNTINLVCSNQSTPVPLKSGVQISNIKGTTSCLLYPISISFSPILGVVSFNQSLGDSCISDLTTESLEVTLQNSAGDKIILINKGGSVEVQ